MFFNDTATTENYTYGHTLSRHDALPISPGEVMLGGGVGEVIRSNHPDWKPGDLVQHDFDFGWQDYPLLKGAGLRRVDPTVAPPSAWMGWYGVNGLTALFGLIDCGAVAAGDTVVASASARSGEHPSELQSLIRHSSAVSRE